MKPTSIILVALVLVVTPALVWMLGPGAAWVLEHIDQATTLQGKDRVDALAAIRGNVLAVATGLAALLAVFYTARNADTARRAFQLSERGHDTDRFSKAVEQLGSAQAPVRLGGLYALEQLAQINPALRQTIVDVICAYLRMPYTPPRQEKRHGRIRTALRARIMIVRSSSGHDPHEERQVRLTAQRLLADHLRWRKPRRWQRAATANRLFWQDINLDLSGATLLNFDLNECCINHGLFENAIFDEGPWFGGATFNGRAWFHGATFAGRAADVAYFAQTTFSEDAVFQGSTFGNFAQFREATFARGAWFASTTFNNADFTEANFNGTTEFGGMIFTGDARFNRANFKGNINLGDVDGVKIDLTEARVLGLGSNHAWPPGWHLETDAKGAVVRRDETPLAGEGRAS